MINKEIQDYIDYLLFLKPIKLYIMSDIEFTMITTAILLYASAIGIIAVFIHTLYSIYKERKEQ